MALRQNMHNSNSIIKAQFVQNNQSPDEKTDEITLLLIGDGASSKVFWGTYRTEQVVIKEYNKKLQDNRVTEEVVLKEWEILSACFPSRYVVKPIKYSLNPPRIVMEYVANGALDTYMKKKPLTSEQKISIANDVALGLLRLLDIGVVHRDIKTANILITGNLHAKICDFDLSRSLDSLDKMEISGTREYLAIEYYTSVDHTNICLTAADVYSFGIVLLELFIKENEFIEYQEVCFQKKISKQDKAANITKKIDELISDHTNDWPKGLASIITSCLSVDPSKRPNMAIVQRKLDQWLMVNTIDVESKRETSNSRSISLFFSGCKNSFIETESIKTEVTQFDESQVEATEIKSVHVTPTITRDTENEKATTVCCSVM